MLVTEDVVEVGRNELIAETLISALISIFLYKHRSVIRKAKSDISAAELKSFFVDNWAGVKHLVDV